MGIPRLGSLTSASIVSRQYFQSDSVGGAAMMMRMCYSVTMFNVQLPLIIVLDDGIESIRLTDR